jgi:hypothetical protein
MISCIVVNFHDLRDRSKEVADIESSKRLPTLLLYFLAALFGYTQKVTNFIFL